MKIIKAESKDDYARCVAVRSLVFIAEQGFTIGSDCNGEERWEDYLLYAQDQPVATARWRMHDGDKAKIGMVATLKAHRGQGFGKALIRHLSELLAAKDEVKEIWMSAQDHALPFYEELGFKVIGEGYMEEHVPHHKVMKETV